MLNCMMIAAIALLFALTQATPATDQPLARVIGHGVQIYTCGDGDKWVFLAPEATLLQNGAQVGTHGAGPRWTWKDGSAVTGKVVSTTPSADPAKNIPALELTATPVAGTNGFLSHVIRVSRTAAEAGVAPPEGCNAATRGERLRVPYAATYSFWTR